MSALKRLSDVFESAERIAVDDFSRIILMSDCHRGDGSQADEFFRNENLYLSALNHYYGEGFTYIEIGDGDELWENKKIAEIIEAHPDAFRMLKKFYQMKRLYFIYGNHDMVKRSRKYVEDNLYRYYDRQTGTEEILFEGIIIHEGLVLEYHDSRKELQRQIFLVHGHQVDFLNSTIWRIARFMVRRFWKPLELFGISNPTSPAQNQEKKEKIGRRLTKWVIRENRMLIAGHNHRPMFPEIGEPLYFNDGSCAHPLFITGIEIDKGEISLVKWSIKVKGEGILYVGRDVIAGPKNIQDFISAKRIFETCSFRDPASVS